MFKSIKYKLLAIIIGSTLIVLTVLGISVVRHNNATLEKMIESKGNILADFVVKLSADYYLNYDFASLKSLAEEAARDREISGIAFLDAGNKPLFSESAMDLDGKDGLMLIERKIQTPGGELLGFMKMGYNTSSLQQNLRDSVVFLSLAFIAVILLLSVIVVMTVRLITDKLAIAVTLSNKLSEGDFDLAIDVTNEDETGQLLGSMKNMGEKIKGIVSEIDQVTEAAINGDLQKRCNVRAYGGEFARILEGMNGTMDAVVGPLHMAAEHIEQISRGEMPDRIKEDFKGDFNRIKDNLNMLIDSTTEVIEVTEEIAGGNLRVKVQERSSQDKLTKALNHMLMSLTQLVVMAKRAASNVASGSQQLSSSAEAMSQGASEQASVTEEVSSSMEQMVANIRQNSENAFQTDKIAQQASEDAGVGRDAVTRTVEAMRDIADKTVIIQEIARQTNLLALNAAIEAARAGDHGKSFAVVAAEVRKLAERSQKAASQISELTSTSVDIAEKAGESLNTILPSIETTATLVQEISASSNEQNLGAEQISNSLQQLDNVTQESASSAEEVSATAGELMGMSRELIKTVSVFKTDAGSPDTAYPENGPVLLAVDAGETDHKAHHHGNGDGKAPAVRAGAPGGVSINLNENTYTSDNERFESY